MNLNELVGDWGGFEKLVAALHESGDVSVERDVLLPGGSGAARQIDVLIRHRQGLYEHLIVVECKYWRQSIKRLHVDALATTVREVGAAKGVIFTTKGFQAGAVTQARHDGIDLFVLRDLRAQEWGSPGRIVDMFLQVIQIGLRNIDVSRGTLLTNAGALPDPADARLDLRLGEGATESATPLLKRDGTLFTMTLEGAIFEGVQKAADRGLARVGLFNEGTEGIYYLGCPATLRPSEPFIVPRKNGVLIIPEIGLDVALKFNQSRITVDRSANLEFALAVESKVTGKVSTVARETGGNSTILGDVADPAQRSDEPALQNGSVARVMIKGYFDFSDTAHLTPVPIEEVSGAFRYIDPNCEQGAE